MCMDDWLWKSFKHLGELQGSGLHFRKITLGTEMEKGLKRQGKLCIHLGK